MMWNEKEAVKEAIVDIIRFLDNLDCYEEEVEDELRAYIQQKYGVYSELERIEDSSADKGRQFKWRHNIIIEEDKEK